MLSVEEDVMRLLTETLQLAHLDATHRSPHLQLSPSI
jgi:hypothetical protein